jgi:hypothetical protein
MDISQAFRCTVYFDNHMGCFPFIFVIFIPLVTKQINYLSTIETGKIVQLVQGPIDKIEKVLMSFNQELSGEISIKEYFEKKIADILNINVIQDFLGSLIGSW